MDELKLVVAADGASLRKATARLSGRHFFWAYVGQDIAKYHQVKRAFEGNGTYHNVTQDFHQAAQDLREPYLRYLYDIVRQHNTLGSWLTSLSYRSGYVSKTFHRACYLKVTLDLLRSWPGLEPLIVAVGDSTMLRSVARNIERLPDKRPVVLGSRGTLPLRGALDVLRMLAHRAAFMLREAGQLLHSRRLIRHPFLPSEPTTVILTPVHAGNLGRGAEFHKTSFGDLANQFTARGHRIALAPLVLRDVDYPKALTRTAGSPFPILVPHRYLRFRDLFGAAVSSMVKPRIPRPLPRFAGMDVATLVEEDLRIDWVSNQAAASLRVAAVVRRWAKLGASIDRIIYRYENQPWERALCWEAKRSLPNASLVGYQHARAPRLLLSYYLAPGEADNAPLPDRVVTNGEYTARLLSSDGYNPGRVYVGGALHVPGLADAGPPVSVPREADERPVVLVAASFGLEEAGELVDLAGHLFGEDESVRVVIKCHPTTPIQKLKGLMSEPLPSHVEVSQQSIAELMLESSVMVYTGSSVCIEALGMGLPVVHLRPQFDLDMDPLESYPELRMEATGLEELREKVRWLLYHREEYVARHRERWQMVTREMYGPVTEQSYLAFVE